MQGLVVRPRWSFLYMVFCAAGMALAAIYDSAEKLKAIVDRLLHRSRHLISIAILISVNAAIILGQCRSATCLLKMLRIFCQQGYCVPHCRGEGQPLQLDTAVLTYVMEQSRSQHGVIRKRHSDYTSTNLDNQADIPGLTVVIFLECGSMMIASLPSFCA